MTPEEAADNWDLPVEAIEEIRRYCASEEALLKMEAAEEARRLAEAGPPAGDAAAVTVRS